MPPKPPSTPSGQSQSGATQAGRFSSSSGTRRKAHRVVIYSTGGGGKTTLLSSLRSVGIRPQIFDLDNGSDDISIDRVEGVQTFGDIIDALNEDALWEGFGAVGIDTLTNAEELAAKWVLQTIAHEKGHRVKSIDDYGYGKGYTHIYDQMLRLYAALDRHYRLGRHVICTAHDCISDAPNPCGDDFLRSEPRLQSPSSGKSSVRLKTKEWCDHLLYIAYDVNAKDGKATGAGTRSIFTSELPQCLAKSRTISGVGPIPFQGKEDATIWKKLFQSS